MDCEACEDMRVPEAGAVVREQVERPRGALALEEGQAVRAGRPEFLYRFETAGRPARARDEDSVGVAPCDPEPSLWTCTKASAEVRAGRERPRAAAVAGQ